MRPFLLSFLAFFCESCTAYMFTFLEDPSTFLYGFDGAKADFAIVDSPRDTWVPTSINEAGQVIYIKSGGGRVYNVGTNPKTRIINDADEGTTMYFSPLKLPETAIDVEDKTANLIWGDMTWVTPQHIEVTKAVDAVQYISTAKAIAHKASFDIEKADLFQLKGGKQLSLPTVYNENGVYIHMMAQGDVQNVGDAPRTFLMCTAQVGECMYDLSPRINPSTQIIVYNTGMLVPLRMPETLPQHPLMSFRQNQVKGLHIEWVPAIRRHENL